MIKTIEIVNNTEIEVLLIEGFNFGNGFRYNVELGLNKGFINGYFLAKSSKKQIGTWRVNKIIYKKDNGSFFIKLWRKLNRK